MVPISLQWRHNGRYGVSNHQPHDCLLNCFRRRSSKLHVTISIFIMVKFSVWQCTRAWFLQELRLHCSREESGIAEGGRLQFPLSVAWCAVSRVETKMATRGNFSWRLIDIWSFLRAYFCLKDVNVEYRITVTGRVPGQMWLVIVCVCVCDYCNSTQYHRMSHSLIHDTINFKYSNVGLILSEYGQPNKFKHLIFL